MAKEYRKSGFSDRAENEGHRLINKDGSYNVDKSGLNFFQRFSLFHWLIHLSFWKFLLFLLGIYLSVNAGFALVYTAIGLDSISGDVPDTFVACFIKAFYFSTQTMTTVGYGALYPQTNAASVTAAIEAFIGLLGFAMATGLLYGRFSRPKARILFSQHAVIAPYRDGKGLMIRLANAKESQITNLTARMTYSELISVDGEKKRKFYSLDLELDEISALVTAWTLVHPVVDGSPFTDINADELTRRKVEVIVHLRGYDETYSQIVQTRASFTSDEIVDDARFVKVLGHNDDGRATLDLDGLGRWERV